MTTDGVHLLECVEWKRRPREKGLDQWAYLGVPTYTYDVGPLQLKWYCEFTELGLEPALALATSQG